MKDPKVNLNRLTAWSDGQVTTYVPSELVSKRYDNPNVSDETRAAALAAQAKLVAACKDYVRAREAAGEDCSPEASKAKLRLHHAIIASFEIDQKAADEAGL